MIRGASENFCTLRVHRGGAQGADLGAQREQNTALNFVPFWFPYLNTLLCGTFQPHLLPHLFVELYQNTSLFIYLLHDP